MTFTPLIRNAPLRGLHFRPDKAKEIANDLVVDEAVEVAHDSTNEHDQYAVAVIARGVHIGYLPAELSAAVLAIANVAEVVAAVTAIGPLRISVALKGE